MSKRQRNASTSSQVFGSQARFLMLPSEFLKSDCYKTLNASSKALYIDLCRQYTPPTRGHYGNNGDLTAAFEYMRDNFGWASSSTVTRAKKELLERGILLLSKRQWAANKPNLYALSTHNIDFCDDGKGKNKHELKPTKEPPNKWKEWRSEPAKETRKGRDITPPWEAETEP